MTQTVWRDTASSACLGAARNKIRLTDSVVQQGYFFKIHFIFWEERKNHLKFASTTTIEVLYAETFSEWLSAVWGCSSVWGRNLSSPNYHQLHACMDGKEKKNCEWKLIYQCLDHLAIVQWEIHTTCFMGSVLWTDFCEEFLCGGGIFFFILPRSDLLLPVNSCECVAQDFLSICKSKKFFFPFFPPVSFAYTLSLRERMRMREWQVKKPSLQLELIWRSRSSAFSREVDLRKRRG